MSKIRLALFDFDGINTSNQKIYGKDGLCHFKATCDRDWTALKRFRAAGVHIHYLTGDSWNEDILSKRNIPHVITRGQHKEDFLSNLCIHFGVKPEEVAYIGDDLFDIGLLKAVGYPFCPLDATLDIRRLVPNCKRLERKGGDNVIEELFYWCRKNKLIPHLPFEEEYQKILNLDSREKF